MKKSGVFAIAGVAIVTFLYLVYLAINFEAPSQTTTITLPMPNPIVVAPSNLRPEITTQNPAARAQPASVAPPAEEVAMEGPVEESLASETQLPRLNDSDEFLLSRLADFRGGEILLNFLVDDQIIRKAVTLIENMTRGEIPQSGLPYKAIGSEIIVSEIDRDFYQMEEASFTRFDKVVDALIGFDGSELIALYRLFSPLMRRAYSELGYDGDAFDAAVLDAISRIVAVSLEELPLQLVKPSVMYLYADSRIEDLPDLDKLLIRLGPKNLLRLQSKLRSIEGQL
jgi:hypothetical protein